MREHMGTRVRKAGRIMAGKALWARGLASHASELWNVSGRTTDDICVWRINLDRDFTENPETLLSADERERSLRIVAPSVRLAWIRSRAALRVILADYGSDEASALRFGYGPYGKPRLAGRRLHGPPIYFSLSRSAGICVIAVSRKRPIGIDIEQITDRAGLLATMMQFLGQGEIEAIQRLPKEQRLEAAFEAWTRKEAFAKAIGLGLQLPLPGISVTSGADHVPAVSAVAREDIRAWRLISFAPEEGYLCSLAIRDGRASRAGAISMRCLSQEGGDEIWPLLGVNDP